MLIFLLLRVLIRPCPDPSVEGPFVFISPLFKTSTSCSAVRGLSSKVPQSLFIRTYALKTYMNPCFPKTRTPTCSEYRSVLGKLNWLQSRTQFHISYLFSRCASASASATILDAKELNKVVRLVKDKPNGYFMRPSREFLDPWGSRMQPTRKFLMVPHSADSSFSYANHATRRETQKGR